MNLDAYYDKSDNAGSHLETGEHRVRVTKYRTIDANSGNKGVAFTVQDAMRCTSETDGFWFSEAALPRLARFAKACGMTREEMSGYNPMLPQSHQLLVGREFIATVTPQPDKPQYGHVSDWRSVDEETADDNTGHQHAPPPGDVIPTSTAPESATPQDDIPF